MSDARTQAEVREDIEQTRDELADTVEQLSAKADVKTRVQDKAAEVKEQATEKAQAAAESVRATTPDDVQAHAQSAATAVQERPLPAIAVGGFAAGVLVGWLVARRR